MVTIWSPERRREKQWSKKWSCCKVVISNRTARNEGILLDTIGSFMPLKWQIIPAKGIHKKAWFLTSGYGAHGCSVTGHNPSRFGFESFAWWKRSCCLWSCHVLAKRRSENARHLRKHYGWWIFIKSRVSPSTTIPFQNLGGNHQSAAMMLPGLWTPGARSLQRPPEPGNLSNKQAGFIREDKEVEVGISGRKHCIEVCSMSFDRFTHQFVSVSCLILHLMNTSSTEQGGGGSFRTGNLQETLVVVNQGWQSEATDWPKGGWSCVCWSVCNGCNGHLTHNCWM